MHYYIDVFKKYAIFSGRARRSEFWYFVLFNFIVALIITIIGIIIVLSTGNKIIGNLPSQLYSLATLIPMLAVSSRRMHDIGKNNWIISFYGLMSVTSIINGFFPNVIPSFVLNTIYLICLVGLIWFIVLACTDSNPSDNKYGSNPKTPTPEPTVNQTSSTQPKK